MNVSRVEIVNQAVNTSKYFTPYPGVSSNDFEQVNARWDDFFVFRFLFITYFYVAFI